MGCSGSTAAQLGVHVDKERDQEQEFRQRYGLGCKLGTGAYGQVRECKRRNEDKAVLAVKILDARQLTPGPKQASKDMKIDKERLQMMKDEVKLWSMIGDHPNVVRLEASFQFCGRCFIVMEKCSDTLLTRLDSLRQMSEQSMGEFFYQVACSLEPVHKAGIVHRDIKPDNFLFGGLDGQTLKLCDFGLSAIVPNKGLGTLKGTYGTPPYMSPEMLQRENPHHSFPSDIWSFGSMAYLMLYGEFPHMPSPCVAATMKTAIITDSPKMRWARIDGTTPSPVCVTFVQSLLVRDEGRRPKIADVLQFSMMKKMAQSPAFTSEAYPSEKPKERCMPPRESSEGTAESLDKKDSVELVELIRRARINAAQFRWLDHVRTFLNLRGARWWTSCAHAGGTLTAILLGHHTQIQHLPLM